MNMIHLCQKKCENFIVLGPTKTAFFCYQACGISLSVGLLLHGLVLCGHGGVVQMAQQLGHDWRSILENKVKLRMIYVAIFFLFYLLD